MFKHLIIISAFVFSFYPAFLQGQSLPGDLNDCSNIGAERGEFLGWRGIMGEWTAAGDSIRILNAEEGLDSMRHRIRHFGMGRLPEIKSEEIPFVPQGSNYAIQLGNSRNGHQYERLVTSFLVDSSNSLFQYRFAVIFEDPDHTPAEQPKFEVQVQDQLGNTVPCGFYQVTAGGNIPGFRSEGSIRYRNWTTAAVDLRSYIGQTVTIRISTYDCSRGGHWGMALFDATCMPAQVQSVDYCPDRDSTITLEAPLGFRDYEWSTGDTTRTIVIKKPQKGQEVSVAFTPYSSLSDGCRLSLSFVIPAKLEIILPERVAVCSGREALLTPILQKENEYAYYWSPGGSTTKTLTTTQAGRYMVQATRGDCTLRDTVDVAHIAPPALTFTEQQPACAGKNNGALTAQAQYPEALLYRWNTGAAEAHIDAVSAGTYTVTATGVTNGCSVVATRTLTPAPSVRTKASVLQRPFCKDSTTHGQIVAMPDGGLPPYRYTWSNGERTPTAKNIVQPGVYQVTVRDAADCLAVDSVEVTLLQATIQTSGNYCPEGSDGTIDITAGGGRPPYRYQLFGQGVSSNQPRFANLPNDRYRVVVQDADGCVQQYPAEVKLMREKPFEVSLPADTLIGLGQSLTLTAVANYPVARIWWSGKAVPEEHAALDLTIQPLQTTEVRVEAEDAYGCLSEASLLIQVEKRKGIYIPNVFKPAGSAERNNHHFYISVLPEQFKSVPSFVIFDRWGNQVYQNFSYMPNQPDRGWDGVFEGQPAPPGVYAYRIEVEYIDGSREMFTGDVTLVR